LRHLILISIDLAVNLFNMTQCGEFLTYWFVYDAFGRYRNSPEMDWCYR